MIGVTQLLLIPFIGIVSVYLLQLYQKWKNIFYHMGNIPGPRTLPLLGNGHLFIGSRAKVMTVSEKLSIEFPSTFRLWCGPQPIVVVNDTADLQILLNHPEALHKAALTSLILTPLLQDGLLNAHPKKWQQRRKLIESTFSKRILDSIQPIFRKHAEILLECLSKFENGEEFDILPYLSKASLDIICATSMGVEINSQKSETNYLRAANKILEISGIRAVKFWYHNDFIFGLTNLGRSLKQNLKVVHGFSRKVINDRKLGREKTIRTSIPKDELVVSKKKPFLDYLLDMSEQFPSLTDEELLKEVVTMIFAGYETTANSVARVLLMLGIHQDIQNNVFDEIYNIFGDSDRDITAKDLNDLKYLQMVCQETLRLFPPIAVFLRDPAIDLKLATCIVPKGAAACVWVPCIHMNQKIWPDPEKFDPSRFTSEAVANRSPYSFLPFSAGPRNCVGYKFAYRSMKVQLATILRKYRVRTSIKREDIVWEFNISIHSKYGFPIMLEKRNPGSETTRL